MFLLRTLTEFQGEANVTSYVSQSRQTFPRPVFPLDWIPRTKFVLVVGRVPTDEVMTINKRRVNESVSGQAKQSKNTKTLIPQSEPGPPVTLVRRYHVCFPGVLNYQYTSIERQCACAAYLINWHQTQSTASLCCRSTLCCCGPVYVGGYDTD